MLLSILATAKGSISCSVFTKIPLSAPIANAVLMVSCDSCGPIEIAITSSACDASLILNACSTAISSNGFIAIFTLASSTPELSGLTLTLTL